MIKVAAYTGGLDEACARFRLRQYVPLLQRLGVEVHDFSARRSMYPPEARGLMPFWALEEVGARLPGVVRSYRYDVVFLQREMLASYVTLEPFTSRPRVLDVDDAIWLRRRGITARHLAGICDHVICGNHFLAENFARWNPRVSILPTAVDTDRYQPADSSVARDPVIGWSGNRSGFPYLYAIERSLAAVLHKHKKARLRIIADRAPRMNSIPAGQFEFIQWSPESEVLGLQGMTIGIMPLDDSVWARGKCSYKMLAYMACGLPVVVSPVGMNAEVLGMGTVGMAPRNETDWVDAIDWLIVNPDKALTMGRMGREVVSEHFSVRQIGPRLARLLRLVAGKG